MPTPQKCELCGFTAERLKLVLMTHLKPRLCPRCFNQFSQFRPWYVRTALITSINSTHDIGPLRVEWLGEDDAALASIGDVQFALLRETGHNKKNQLSVQWINPWHCQIFNTFRSENFLDELLGNYLVVNLYVRDKTIEFSTDDSNIITHPLADLIFTIIASLKYAMSPTGKMQPFTPAQP